MLLVTKERMDRRLLRPQLEDLEVSERLLNLLLHSDSRQQLRREVCLEVPLLLQLVDCLVLLRRQRLGNLLQHLRLFLELLHKLQLVVYLVRLHLPPLLGLRLPLHLELLLRRQLEVCLVRLQHRLL